MRSHRLGKQGEDFALEFLRHSGYTVITTNYRTRLGEIDIIARDGETIAFIEVKTRVEDGWNAFEAVSPSKQRRMFRVAEQYLAETFRRVDVQARFDVLAVWAQEDGTMKGDILKNAFTR